MDENLQVRDLNLNDIDDFVAIKREMMISVYPYMNTAVEKNVYEWLLKDNPYRSPDFPVGFALEGESGIAGIVLLEPANFWVFGKRVYGCIEVSIKVKRAFHFHGLKLLNKAWNSNLFPIVIGSNPNPLNYKLEKGMGALGIAFTAYRYFIFVSVKHFAFSFTRSYFLKVFAFVCSKIRLMLKNITQMNRVKEEFIVEETKRFDARFDRLNERISKDYDIMHVKDSCYLNWRYVDFPYAERKIFAISDKNGLLRGCIVLQIEPYFDGPRIINVIELLAEKKDLNAMRTLLRIATNYAKTEKIDRVMMTPSSEIIAKILQTEGFIKRKFDFPRFLYKFNDQYRSGTGDAMPDWFISQGEGDAAIYPGVYTDE